jgi:hypothetical protein
LQGLCPQLRAKILVAGQKKTGGRILTPDAASRQMKRTITEIFIEVEETIAVRQTARIADSENELRPMNETAICPHCGQTIPKNKNLQQEEENKDESQQQ